jgi:hypothetical protein
MTDLNGHAPEATPDDIRIDFLDDFLDGQPELRTWNDKQTVRAQYGRSSAKRFRDLEAQILRMHGLALELLDEYGADLRVVRLTAKLEWLLAHYRDLVWPSRANMHALIEIKALEAKAVRIAYRLYRKHCPEQWAADVEAGRIYADEADI